MKNGKYDLYDWLFGLAGLGLIIAILVAVLVQCSAPASASVPGDVDGDGHVNAIDASLIAAAYLSYPAYMRVNPAVNARWDPRADLNHNGQVEAIDWSTMALYYGE